MFKVGDVRDKAMLSLATSLGWEISGFVKLKRKTLQDLIERSRQTGEKFIYFRNIRQKTGVLRLGVLNPLAVEWLNKWLKTSRNVSNRKLKKVNPTSNIFNLTDRGIQNRLKILARRADIKTTGRVRFHNIRKWVMSGLSRSGFNEFQIKYVLGKAIPMSDAVYLQSLDLEIRERYPEAYENYLNLNPSVSPKAMTSLSKEINQLNEENAELKKRLEKMEIMIRMSQGPSREEMKQIAEQQQRIISALKKQGLVTTL